MNSLQICLMFHHQQSPKYSTPTSRYIATQLKSLIFWSPKEKIREHLPEDLVTYRNLRATIDCTEVQVRLWLQYSQG